MEGAESSGKVKEIGSTGQGKHGNRKQKLRIYWGWDWKRCRHGQSLRCTPVPFLAPRGRKKQEEHCSISLSYLRTPAIYPHLAHLSSLRAIAFTQALSGTQVAHSAQLILCTGLYILMTSVARVSKEEVLREMSREVESPKKRCLAIGPPKWVVLNQGHFCFPLPGNIRWCLGSFCLSQLGVGIQLVSRE